MYLQVSIRVSECVRVGVRLGVRWCALDGSSEYLLFCLSYQIFKSPMCATGYLLFPGSALDLSGRNAEMQTAEWKVCIDLFAICSLGKVLWVSRKSLYHGINYYYNESYNL